MAACLLSAARAEGATAVVGQYVPSEKNALVSGLYRRIGFEACPAGEGEYVFSLADRPIPTCEFIRDESNKEDTVQRGHTMTLRIVPYAAEHEEAVRAFNARLAEHDLDVNKHSTSFYESHVPSWLPKRPDCDLYQEYFVALDDPSVVRGGYVLKHQWFLVRGEPLWLADYRLPISEGICDRRFVNVAVSLYVDAMRRKPYLFGLGGGTDVPAVKFLQVAGWQSVLVPFLFRVVHPAAFLRNIAMLRTSTARRGASELLRCSGMGWLGIKTIQRIQGRHRRPRRVTFERVAEFSDWADDVWNESQSFYSLIGVRDRKVLDVLYPASETRFIRLKVDARRQGHRLGRIAEHARCRGTSNSAICGWERLVDCLARPDDAREVVVCARDYLGGQRRRPDRFQSGEPCLVSRAEGVWILDRALESSVSGIAQARCQARSDVENMPRIFI